MLRFRCKECGAFIDAARGESGDAVQCRQCGSPNHIPDSASRVEESRPQSIRNRRTGPLPYLLIGVGAILGGLGVTHIMNVAKYVGTGPHYQHFVVETDILVTAILTLAFGAAPVVLGIVIAVRRSR